VTREVGALNYHEWLRRRYVNEGASVRDLANELCVGRESALPSSWLSQNRLITVA
jgi:hypothetical protein